MELAANYRSSEDSMYTIVDMVCQNCTDDLKVFSAHKKKYTLEYIQGVENMRALAMGIPNQTQRQAAQDKLRNDVISAAENCCADCRSLQTYITTDGFLAKDIPAMRKLAGEDYYAAASNNNLQATGTMMGLMNNFMGDYSDELTNADMPSGFPGQCSEEAQVFTTALKAYNNYKITAEQQTAAKLTANNNLYTKIKSILDDGKYIFRKDAGKRKLYSYEALLSKIRKKKTGYWISLIDSVTKKPVDSATITLLQGDGPIASNKKGIILIEIKAGDYNYTITAPNYQTVTGVFTVDTGVVHRDYFEMKEVAAKQATA